MHDLRHAYATTLAERGVHPVIVSTVLGHATAAFTMRVYQKAWDAGIQEAGEAIGEAIGRGRNESGLQNG